MAAPRAWEFDFNAISPLIQYAPTLSDGSNTSTGWGTFYDATSETSHRITRTQIAVFGNTNASYAVYFDGYEEPQLSSQKDVLYQSNEANLGGHSLKLTVLSNYEMQYFKFHKFVVTSSAVSISKLPKLDSFASDDAEMMVPHGTWHTKTSSNSFPLNSQPLTTVRSTNSPGDSMNFSFRGRAIAIYGPVNATSGLFSFQHRDAVNIVNAGSPIPIDETLIYYQDGFNESIPTTVSITNLGIGETTFSMSRAEIYSLNSSTSNNNNPGQGSKHIKTIIIGVIADVVFGVVAVILGIVLMKRQRRREGIMNRKDAGINTIIPYTVRYEVNGYGRQVTKRQTDHCTTKAGIGGPQGATSVGTPQALMHPPAPAANSFRLAKLAIEIPPVVRHFITGIRGHSWISSALSRICVAEELPTHQLDCAVRILRSTSAMWSTRAGVSLCDAADLTFSNIFF
ncbi:uncharacterized protein FOMMEDRAFT_25800 [Fomitiporia mediterranea MF3/22]|uniref:uncharacterized protein n=1 Tax=Fomitiporia mediterranea (strain MF3/22) TaxID=694068 RepID=UPI0004408F6B|nr:uncharacterized protein FOMMEDRAFT_25800 [Fomitiporia mediterranea MF3/22]EJD06548.1 hypothetical protein FOMMEDRAFT_25800 [Fomitiporia mediterranea MF3/22]